MDDGRLPPEWEEVLGDLAHDVDAAETLLASLHDGTGDGTGDDRTSPTAAREGSPPPALSGLDAAQRAALRHRLTVLNARTLAVVSRLATARAENRRHRALLERAASPQDRPVYVDRRA